MPLKLHPATEQNLQQVVSWINNIQDCRLWAGPFVSYPVRLQVLINETGFRPDNSFIFKYQGNVIAFGQLIKKDKGHHHLARIITSPDFRGKGYGWALCKALVSMADDRGDETTLNVYRSNRTAITLYEQLGFSEDRDKSTAENVFMLRTSSSKIAT